MVEVVFLYKGTSSTIQCNESDLMKNIIEKFILKAELDIHKIYFLYGGTIINKELSFKELTKETNEKKIIILVLDIEDENAEKKEEKKELKKSNIIICPICKDICKVSIENYQIKLYGCENGHTINDISVNDFNETQYIDESKIICDNCKLANKKDQYNKEFKYCITCKQKLCILCMSKHDKSHTILDYDKKNYLCHKHHYDKFISYCNDCNKNLCYDCETEHDKIHNIISFKEIPINKDHLSQTIENFQKGITIVNEKIEAIFYALHELKKNIENYKDIVCNILNNYEQDNRNYYILNNIKELFENDIIKDLDKIVNNENINICSDFKILMKIYTKMNANNISNELIKNQIGLEIEEFKSEKSWNLSEIQLLQKYGETSICKIYNSDYKKYLGLGFFFQIDPLLKFPFKRGLCTSNHIFPKEFFNNNEYLYFIHKNSNKKISIKECQIFSKNAKYEDFRKGFDKRKIFVDKELDYTFIEILDNDIDKKYELFKLESRSQGYSSDIAILYYNFDKLSFSFGAFQRKNDNSLIHNCFVGSGKKGAPIINLNINNPTIIGIHLGNIKVCYGLGNSMDIISTDIMKNYIKFLYNENSLNNNFTKLTIHKDFITNLILLDENTLCSGSTDGNIIIFNSNNFGILDIIKEKEPIIYHTKLSNNNIILCCKDGSIKIYKEKSKISTIAKIIAIGGVLLIAPRLTPAAIQLLFEDNVNGFSSKYELLEILKGHQESVCQVIEMSEDLIISGGLDTKMKIWKKKGNNFTCINTLTVNDEFGSSTNILKINENEIVSAATNANYIIFWNITNLENKTKIDNIVCHWNRNSMKMINRRTLFVGGDEYNGIYLIDVVKYQVISKIKFEKIAAISAIIKLKNGNILIGCKTENKSEKKEEEEEENISYTYSLIEYKYNSKEKTLTEVRSNENAHINIITGLIKLNHNEIVSCSLDKTIKFWI